MEEFGEFIEGKDIDYAVYNRVIMLCVFEGECAHGVVCGDCIECSDLLLYEGGGQGENGRMILAGKE